MSTFKDNSAIQSQDWNVVSSTQNENLGAAAFMSDGRAFRYAWDGGTALKQGHLYQAPAQSQANNNQLGVLAAAVGATSITVGSSATIAANALSDGVMVVATGAGSGYMYGIASNTAVSAATGCVITLSDPLAVALAVGSLVDVRPNDFNGVVIQPTTKSSAPVGVAVVPTSGSQYAWLQTHGIVQVLVDGAVAAGDVLVPSVSVAGAVSTATAIGTASAVGIALTAGTDTFYVPVNLNLN